MLKSLLKVNGLKKLSKNSQQNLHGGGLSGGIDCYPDRPAPDCRAFFLNGCISWVCGSENGDQ